MFKRLIILMFTILSSVELAVAAERALITINKFVSHPALDAAEEGVKKVLESRAKDKIEIQVSNSQGSVATSAQVARHQASLNPAFMVAIATPAAQGALKVKPQATTLAFVAVTDPVAAGLSSDTGVIGVTDNPPVEGLLDVTLKVLPDLKIMGVIFNPAEVNSQAIVQIMREAAKKRGIQVEEVPITSSTAFKSSMQKLAGKVKVVFLPLDNLVVSAIDGIVKEAASLGIALIASDPFLVDKGLLLALGCDYFKSGEQLGGMIADIIEGKELPENIRPTGIQELKINKDVAERLKITIPDDLK